MRSPKSSASNQQNLRLRSHCKKLDLMENLRSTLLIEDETAPSRDWRKALRSQPAFRIVNKTMRGQTQFITIIGFAGLCALIILYMYPRNGVNGLKSDFSESVSRYNNTYPLSKPIRTSSLYTFKLGKVYILFSIHKIL